MGNSKRHHLPTLLKRQKSFGSHLSLRFPMFLLKALSYQTDFKNALEKFNAPRFYMINEINRDH